MVIAKIFLIVLNTIVATTEGAKDREIDTQMDKSLKNGMSTLKSLSGDVFPFRKVYRLKCKQLQFVFRRFFKFYFLMNNYSDGVCC